MEADQINGEGTDTNLDLDFDNTIWVIVCLNNQMFGIPSGYAREMVLLPEVTRVPKANEYIRGVINLRGKVLPVLDMRKRLNFRTAQEEVDELTDQLDARKMEHVDWFNELEFCLKDGREFKFDRDPDLCAFGKWYNSFKTENMLLHQHLKKFDKPHRAFHQLADTVLSLSGQGDNTEAHEMLVEARNSLLATLVGLFDDTVQLIRSSSREIAVVLEDSGRNMAITVDRVESVEEMTPGTRQDISDSLGVKYDEFITGVARRRKDDSIVLLIDPTRIMTIDVIETVFGGSEGEL